MKISKFTSIFFTLIVFILQSCNANLENSLKTSDFAAPSSLKIQPLATIIDYRTIDYSNLADKKIHEKCKNDINELFNSELNKNIFLSGKTQYGYVVCRQDDAKVGSWRTAGFVIPAICTMMLNVSLGMPLCAGIIKIKYTFDIYDCNNKLISSHKVEGCSREYFGIWQNTNERALLARVFKDALVQFESYCTKNATLINNNLINAMSFKSRMRQLAQNAEQTVNNDFLFALKLYQNNENIRAKQFLDNSINTSPYHAPSYMLRGLILLNDADYISALSDFSQCANLSPIQLNENAYLCKANILNLMGRHEEALAALNEALAIDHNNPRCHIMMADAMIDRSYYSKAISHLEKALDINPNLVELHKLILTIENKQDKLDELERELVQEQLQRQAQASRIMSQAQSSAINSISQMTQQPNNTNYTPVNNNQNSNNNNNRKGRLHPTKQTCSFCNGKGWRAGNSTATYGITDSHYCNECNSYVSASHSHDRCPSCGGTGYTTKITSN